MLTATSLATPPATDPSLRQQLVAVDFDTIATSPETGITLDLSLRAGDGTRAQSHAKASVTAFGQQLISVDRPAPDTPEARQAANAVLDAFAGSELIKQMVPFDDQPLRPGFARISATLADGTRAMYVESLDGDGAPSPDLGAVSTAFDAFTQLVVPELSAEG